MSLLAMDCILLKIHNGFYASIQVW